MPMFARNSQYHQNQSLGQYYDDDINNRTVLIDGGEFGMNYNSELNLSLENTTGYGDKGSVFN